MLYCFEFYVARVTVTKHKGRDSEANDSHVEQSGEEVGSGDISVDSGVHGRSQAEGQCDGNSAGAGGTRLVDRRLER